MYYLVLPEDMSAGPDKYYFWTLILKSRCRACRGNNCPCLVGWPHRLVTEPFVVMSCIQVTWPRPVLELCYLKTESVSEQGRFMARWASIQPSTVSDCILFLNVPFIHGTHVLQASVCRIETNQFGARIWISSVVDETSLRHWHHYSRLLKIRYVLQS